MKLSEYARKNSISYKTAFVHWKKGLIEGYQLKTGTIVVNEKVTEKEYGIYCRVSSHDQKEDLIRQQDRLKNFCASKGIIIKKIYKEIASGLNDNRSQLNQILNSDLNIICEHKDRLTRFGFNYLKNLLNQQNRNIIVINEIENKEDIIEDFVAIITSFCARIYGKRRSKRKTAQLIKDLKIENNPKQ